MRVVDFQPMLRYFREKFPDSISFSNSIGSGISIRYGPTIEFEIAILKYIEEQDHITLKITHRLVKNLDTNTSENFDFFEGVGRKIEKDSGVKVVLVNAYNKPPVC